MRALDHGGEEFRLDAQVIGVAHLGIHLHHADRLVHDGEGFGRIVLDADQCIGVERDDIRAMLQLDAAVAQRSNLLAVGYEIAALEHRPGVVDQDFGGAAQLGNNPVIGQCRQGKQRERRQTSNHTE